MSCHNPDLGSASDWLYCMGNLIPPIRSNIQWQHRQIPAIFSGNCCCWNNNNNNYIIILLLLLYYYYYYIIIIIIIIIFGNSPLLAWNEVSYFLPNKSTTSIFSLQGSFAAFCSVLVAIFSPNREPVHRLTIVSKSVLQPNLSYKIIFVFAYCHWDLDLTRSDPGLFLRIQRIRIKKLSLYDNENVRV